MCKVTPFQGWLRAWRAEDRSLRSPEPLGVGGYGGRFISRVPPGPPGSSAMWWSRCSRGAWREDDDPVRSRCSSTRHAWSRAQSPQHRVRVRGRPRRRGCYALVMEYVQAQTARDSRPRRTGLAHVAAPLLADGRVAAAPALAYAHTLRHDGRRSRSSIATSRRRTSWSSRRRREGRRLRDREVGDRASSHTRAGTLKGKLATCRPSRSTATGVDHRTDIFALGVVL